MTTGIVEKAKEMLGLEKGEIKIAGRKVYGTGYGLMGLTWREVPPPVEQSFESMRTALRHGANFWNGGELYGPPERNSLHLLKEYFEKYPEDASKVVISIKGGMVPGQLKPDGSAENTRRSIDKCLSLLGSKRLDIWESARVDPNVPVEITMRTANEYVKTGKLGGICLSECSAETIRRAAKEAKIVGVEVEFSLFETTILDNGVAQTCAELDIPIIAYSPLGRGFLTGQIKKASDIPEGDLRRSLPRLQGENFEKNLDLVREVEKIAERKGHKPSQIAIAWVKAQSKKPGMPTIIPIPGASSPERVAENLTEADLSDNDVKELDSILASFEIHGARLEGHLASLAFGNSPELKE